MELYFNSPLYIWGFSLNVFTSALGQQCTHILIILIMLIYVSNTKDNEEAFFIQYECITVFEKTCFEHSVCSVNIGWMGINIGTFLLYVLFFIYIYSLIFNQVLFPQQKSYENKEWLKIIEINGICASLQFSPPLSLSHYLLNSHMPN